MNNIVVKLGFTKSKAYGLCGTILMAALFSTAVAKADEVKASDAAPAIEAVAKTNETPAVAETSATEAAKPEAAKTEAVVNAPTEEAVSKAETAVNEALEPKAPTEVTKEGTEIKVKNPEVELTLPEGVDKYHGFKVEYKNVQIPDEVEVNKGDSVVFTLPKEVSFQTNFDFPVTNPSNDVVGHASTSIENGTITTTFNDYFKSHPLNKQMSLTFDAKWTEAVKPGEKVKLNFNGSVQEVKIGERDVVPGDQLVAKWGSQSESDPETINWVVRLNYARKTLENLTVKDVWSKNQSFVEGSQKMYTVENMEAWTGVEDAKSYLESWNVRADGFDVKLKTFNKLLYLEYQTKLKTGVKDSFNPTNVVTLDGVASNQKSNAIVNLVGGKGNAQGENVETPEEPEKPVTPETPEKPAEPEKPVTPETPEKPAEPEKPVTPEKPEEPEKPAEPEKPVTPETPEKPEEPSKPEEPTSEVPGDAPIVDIPEYNEPIGTTPWDAPILEKPEYKEPIGTTPWDAPVLTLPELKIPLIPLVPETPESPETPEHEGPRGPKDNIYREVKVIKSHKSEHEDAAEPTKSETKITPVRVASNDSNLPSTGEKSSSTLAVIGAAVLSVLAAGVYLFRKKHQ